MEKKLAEKIVVEVRRWAEANSSFAKDNPTVSAQLKSLSVDNVSLGEPLQYCIAHIKGDATAVGGSAPQEYNATTKRTEAFEFTTRSFAYFEKANSYCAVELKKLAFLESGLEAVLNTYSGSVPQPANVAEMAAKELAEKSMKRLNFYCYSTRVNEYNIVQETSIANSKWVSICVGIKEPKKGNSYSTTIGFYNTETGELHLSDIESLIKGQPIDSMTSKSTKRKNAIRIIAGVVVLAAIIGAVVYTLVTK
ncbi:MAG: hypothetical protein J1F66_03095 [Clostridiales bacterium]|nr:hypothetical protein [Clostridiales bacterium]